MWRAYLLTSDSMRHAGMLHSMLELMEKMDVGSIAGKEKNDGKSWQNSYHSSFEQPKPWLFAVFFRDCTTQLHRDYEKPFFEDSYEPTTSIMECHKGFEHCSFFASWDFLIEWIRDLCFVILSCQWLTLEFLAHQFWFPKGFNKHLANFASWKCMYCRLVNTWCFCNDFFPSFRFDFSKSWDSETPMIRCIGIRFSPQELVYRWHSTTTRNSPKLGGICGSCFYTCFFFHGIPQKHPNWT